MVHDHNLLLVAVAGLICALTALATCTILRNAVHNEGDARGWWLRCAIVVIGFGVWTTHFVAMLGYGGHGQIRFQLIPTVVSLLAGLLGAFLSLRQLQQSMSRPRTALAGLGIALSTATLHYVGMSALVMEHPIAWNPAIVALSVIAGACLGVPAFVLMTRPERSRRSAAAGSAMMLFSVLALHFIGMEAMTVTHGVAHTPGGLPLSRTLLAIILGMISLVILGWTATLLLLARSKDLEERRRLREMRLLMNGVYGTAIYMLDPEGRVMSWNKGAERLKQFGADEILGQHFEQFYPEAERAAGKPARALQEARETGIFRDIGPRLRKDGSNFYASITIEPIHEADGSLYGFAKITRDISEVRQARSRLDAALDNMQQGLLLLDADRRLVLHNQRIPQLYNLDTDPLRPGMPLGEVIVHTVGAIAGVDTRERTLESAAMLFDGLLALPEGGSAIGETADGIVHALTSRRLDDGGWVITVEDITDRQQATRRLEFMKTHDSLTNLPNRERFDELLEEALGRTRQRGERLMVTLLDLDSFREVNDIHGPQAGDQVLCETARRLEYALAGRGAAARLGGDEFAVFTAIPAGEDHVATAQALCDALQFSCELFQTDHAHRVDCAGSLGVAIYPEDGTSVRELMVNADLAMCRAKADPLQRWTRFAPELDAGVRERRSLQADLRLAIERDELDVVYQVQCAVTDGSVIGYEALLRWNHSSHGPIPPSDFIPPAESSGLILPIGEWVLRRVCREAAAWDKPWKVAVNVSPVQLVQPNLPEIVIEALLESGLPASRLEIEITESAIISDKLRALHNLRRIKHLGVSVAIDDFGTGYSSLDTLKSFAFDKIKIDRSFLMGIRKDEQSRNIVRAVLGLGRSLNLPVLAEGVETAEDLEILRQENCNEAQGYFFGKPGKLQAAADIAAAASAAPRQRKGSRAA